MNKYTVMVLVGLGLLAGLLLGRFTQENRPMSAERKIAYWVDSMEPLIHYPGPGTSRMGMTLTPVYADAADNTTASTVQISPAVVNNLGVRTSPVIRSSLSSPISTVGYVEPDENNISHVHTYANGWVKNLFVKAVGDEVKQGQVVLQLYSPIMVNAEDEFLIALESKNKALIDASYKKLQTFHISEQQIAQLRAKRKAQPLVDIYAHQGGVVTRLNIRQGMYVTSETEMMSIVDLSSVWMIAQVFEDQSSQVKVGGEVEARLGAFPGKRWKGRVDYIYPEVEPETRTVKVRFAFSNPDTLLRPNMYANITLLVDSTHQVLSIPLEALIRSKEGDRVIVALGDGRFQSRAVTVGMESDERIEILSGLVLGELVVVSGQFLLDSEVNLKAGMERLQSPASETKTHGAP